MKRKVSWLVWAVAAALCALGAVVMTRRPDGETHRVPTPEERAALLRASAQRDCDRQQWTRCLGELDEAERFDPAGDRAASVQGLRKRAEKGAQTGFDAHPN